MCQRLASTIQSIAKQIKDGIYQSEAQISQGIVKHVLSELGWPPFNTLVVAPEFKIGNGARKVDYALCHTPGKAVILIEVKDLGKADSKGEKQLFEYAFHQGVPIVVLTDGHIWSFFYPPGQGNYEERRFAQIDLLDYDPCVTASKLARYLNMEDVKSQAARKHAEKDYEEVRLQKQASSRFKSVWHKLLLEPATSLLLDLFLEEVEKETGVRPNSEQAVEFIRNQAMGRPMPTTSNAHNSAVIRKKQPRQRSPISSTQIAKDWIELTTWNPPVNTPSPEKIKFPDGTEKITRKWNEILIFTSEWLSETGKLTSISTSIFSGPRSREKILDTDFSGFRSYRQIAGTSFFLNLTWQCRSNAKENNISCRAMWH